MQQEPMFAGPWKVSTSICYEVVYAELVRSAVSAPDMLSTISNDTWFGKSIGPIQHMQMARMRALENGRYLIRATNNGITAIVDERGNIQHSLPQFTRDVLRGEIRIMTGTTPFSRWGSVPVLLICGLGLFFSALMGKNLSDPGWLARDF
jgi:apolipoprotein N-acyltransferase